MKKILITGANSYIGMSFEDYMKPWESEIEIETVDMIDGSWREKDFSGYDVVFHVAGIAHIKETKENQGLYYKVNRDLAIEVAKKAKKDGVKQFIFLSSMSVYGMDTGVVNRETVENPKSAYGKSKLQAEQEIVKLQSEDFNICVLRPPMVYGKDCKGNYVTLSKYAKKLPVFPDIDNHRSMIYIDNLSEFIRLMVANQECGRFMPQNSDYIKTSQMVKEIAELSGKRMKLVKLFNPIISVAIEVVGVVNKVFGNLVYDMKLSNYKEEYSVVDFSGSIIKTEN